MKYEIAEDTQISGITYMKTYEDVNELPLVTKFIKGKTRI